MTRTGAYGLLNKDSVAPAWHILHLKVKAQYLDGGPDISGVRETIICALKSGMPCVCGRSKTRDLSVAIGFLLGTDPPSPCPASKEAREVVW